MTQLAYLRRGHPALRQTSRTRAVAGRAISLTLALGLLAGCVSTPPPAGGALTSYAGLARTGTGRTQAAARTDGVPLRAARTLRLEPVTFAGDAQSNATPAQQALIANAMARALCQRLVTRFEIRPASEPADLTVKTVVTRIKPSNAGAAGLSAAISLAIPAPRLPIGLGGFAAEAEAIGPDGGQAAAMVWSRNADIFGGKRASSIGDAYDLSTRFAHDLSKLLIDGRDPPTATPPRRGNSPNAGCAIYGKGPGVSGAVAGLFGAPPEWTDRKHPPLAR